MRTSLTGEGCTYPPKSLFGSTSSHRSSLEEERGEVFAGILQALLTPQPDTDRMAACAFLLQHLARTESRCIMKSGRT